MQLAINGKQVKAMAMLIKGIPQVDIAEELGITNTTLSKWKKQPEFQEEYKQQIQMILDDACGEALQTICDLMRNGSSENVRLKASQDILSRAGYNATAKIEAKTDNKLDIGNGNFIIGWNDNEERMTKEELEKANKYIDEHPDEWINIPISQEIAEGLAKHI